MIVIKSMDDVRRVVNRPLYIRWSRLGPKERPYSLRCGREAEPGLSVMPIGPEDIDEGPEWVAKILADYGHLRYVGARCWLVDGDRVGTGGDGEPVIRPRRYVAVLDKVFEERVNRFAYRRAKAEEKLRNAPFGVSIELPRWNEDARERLRRHMRRTMG